MGITAGLSDLIRKIIYALVGSGHFIWEIGSVGNLMNSSQNIPLHNLKHTHIFHSEAKFQVHTNPPISHTIAFNVGLYG